MSEFDKLDKLKVAAEATAPRYEFPLLQYNMNTPQADQTFQSLAAVLIKFDTDNPQIGGDTAPEDVTGGVCAIFNKP